MSASLWTATSSAAANSLAWWRLPVRHFARSRFAILGGETAEIVDSSQFGSQVAVPTVGPTQQDLFYSETSYFTLFDISM